MEKIDSIIMRNNLTLAALTDRVYFKAWSWYLWIVVVVVGMVVVVVVAVVAMVVVMVLVAIVVVVVVKCVMIQIFTYKKFNALISLEDYTIESIPVTTRGILISNSTKKRTNSMIMMQ